MAGDQTKIYVLAIKSYDWAKEKLLGAVIGGLLVAITMSWYTNRTPHLYRTLGEIFPYKSESGGFSNFQIEIANDGSAIIEDVQCEFEIEDCKILEVMASPPILKPSATVKAEGSKAIIEIPKLNVSERVDVFVKADSDSRDKIRKSLNIELRGKGCVGDSVPLHKTPLWQFFSDLYMLGLFIVFVVLFIAIGFREGKKRYETELLKRIARMFNASDAQVAGFIHKFITEFLNQVAEEYAKSGKKIKSLHMSMTWPDELPGPGIVFEATPQGKTSEDKNLNFADGQTGS